MPHVERPLYALTLRLAGIGLVATLFMLVKLAGESGVALPEIMFWRQAIAIPLLLAWLGLRGELGKLRTQRLGTHGRRAAIGMMGMVGNFGAAVLLPLAEATTLGFTTPLFAVIIGALVMREGVGPWRWAAVVIGFAGVIVIAQPGHELVSPLGAVAGLGAGLMVAIVSFQIRDLGRTEAPAATVFYFALFGALMMLPFLPFTMTAHSGRQWLILVGLGIVGTVGQLLITAALRHGAVSSVIVMDYTSLIWALLFGWAIWGQLPASATWLGAPLIVAAGLLVIWRERRLAKTPSPATAVEAD
jgi:drug/metabolite transporter (DMT)-like permease